MFAKTVVFGNETDVTVHRVVCGDSLYNVVACSDSEMFSTELLHRLLLSSNGEQITAAAAVSGRGNRMSVKAVFTGKPDTTVFDACALVFCRRY